MSGEDVSSWLPSARERLGLSQAELADRLGASANTVARWERGELKVRLAPMLRLALEALARPASRVSRPRG
ncbi:MAG: helix-turn-helix domain-containing protein [Chloroflexi bacterium]|nr:helix-turn-helix domain-containing protein [Chloroflexota bacterium]